MRDGIPDPDISDLDFYMAIEAHVRWKIRLEAYITGASEEKLDPAVVGRDDQCSLGKWIYQAGNHFRDHPHFPELRDIHAQFHRCAGQIVQTADEGETEKARDLLNKGEYPKYSQRIKAELARLALELQKE